MFDWEEHTIPVGNGVGIAALVQKGNVEPKILCIHGISANAVTFQNFARNFPRSRGIISADLRGRGLSSKPGDGCYGMVQHARDMFKIMDYFKIESTVVCGHSMGGFVALEMAALHPERVKRIVLLDSGFPRAEEAKALDPLTIKGLQRAFGRLNPELTFSSYEEYIQYWFPDSPITFETLEEDVQDYYRRDVEEIDGKLRCLPTMCAVTEDQQWMATRGRTVTELKQIQCPVLLIRAEYGFVQGTKPLITDEILSQLKKALTLRDILIKNANHYTLMYGSYTPQYLQAVATFIEEAF
eukprot:GCRY01003546.1.p1 GENE.GCRY01003546.1~~GCRY01003546.1.p1  ORF type:complete len:298 (-),score=48.25 GCRY01003546.1:580-1473(-)